MRGGGPGPTLQYGGVPSSRLEAQLSPAKEVKQSMPLHAAGGKRSRGRGPGAGGRGAGSRGPGAGSRGPGAGGRGPGGWGDTTSLSLVAGQCCVTSATVRLASQTALPASTAMHTRTHARTHTHTPEQGLASGHQLSGQSVAMKMLSWSCVRVQGGGSLGMRLGTYVRTHVHRIYVRMLPACAARAGS